MALSTRFFDDFFEPFNDFPLLSDLDRRRRVQEGGMTPSSAANAQHRGELGSFLGGGHMMRMDVSESDTQYQVKVDMPGFNKEDISITFDHNILRIDGERKEEKREENEKFHFSERKYGRVSRSVKLPSNVSEDNMNATYTNGVLNIMVPKKIEQEKRKTIAIN